jgi:hypothetical protein
MLCGDIKIAITQGENEIARITQATEKGALATKKRPDFSGKYAKRPV